MISHIVCSVFLVSSGFFPFQSKIRIQKKNNCIGSCYEINTKLFADDDKCYFGRYGWPVMAGLLTEGFSILVLLPTANNQLAT